MGIFQKENHKNTTKTSDGVYELDDGYVIPSYMRKAAFEGLHGAPNIDKAGCSSKQDTQQHRASYPLTPKFNVYLYESSSSESLSSKYHDIGETQRDVIRIRPEEAYPQFLQSFMRIDKYEVADGHLKKKSKFLRFLDWCRCSCPKRVDAVKFSAEYKVDGVTTLHRLQGDEESDTGVPDPIRKLRHRRSVCY